MYDIIVIGGGPAGLTAALYASRAGKKVLVLEGETTGGQINYSPRVDNYPGLPGVSGSEFAAVLTRQVQEQGAEIVSESVTFFRVKGELLEVRTDSAVYTGIAVIIATGVSRRKLGLEGEDELTGMGVSYCAVCDGAFYSGLPTAVVGGGDTALQDALFLSERCSSVTLIHRRDLFRGQYKLVEQLREKSNVEFIMDSTVEKLNRDENGLTGLVLRNRKTGGCTELAVNGLFVAVGLEPRNGVFSQQIMCDDAGYLLTGQDCSSSLSGVFAAGDCRRKEVRQLTTAVADGSVAALAACRYVDSRRSKMA